MKNSIRTRLILILTVCIAVFVAINLLMNITFLEDYYTYQKKDVLGDIYDKVNTMCQEYEGSDVFLSNVDAYYALDGLGANNGVTLYLFSTKFDVFLNCHYNFKFPYVNTQSNAYRMVTEQLGSYIGDYYGWTTLGKNYQVINTSGNYNVYKVYDDRIGSNYLELFGKIDRTTFVYLRVNYQNMKESVAVSNQFITYIGLIVVIIAAIVMFFIGRRFTKPILQLADIADRMTHLDFDAKYEVKSNDEIGQLGKSMNMLSEQLEHTVSELKSANNELQSDIERKVQIDEMRQEFLSNVSHELKTPIALIQGYAEGLQDDIIDNVEDRQFYCDVITDEAKKMNRLVMRLLDLNQLEFGNDKLNMERFDIVEVIKSVVAASDILFRQKNVEVSIYEPVPVIVWAEEYLVEEVLTNYVSNALNHVNDGGRIRVFTRKSDGIVRISVFNTGSHIDEDDIDKIWVKFYKVDKARTREYGGNGIGLSIVRAIMNSFNRECGVENHDDGVEFWFELDTSNE